MVDQAIEYKSLLNKVDIMINNVNTLGMDTKRYKETLKKIIDEVESSTKVSKTKWGNNASMILICDYGLGIKKLRALELELSEYEVYFKAINSCEYLLMKIDRIDSVDSKEEVKSYANEIIESLKSIKFSSTIHYSDEKKIVEKIYDVAYRIIKLEIITMGSSEVYEYIKKYDVDTYFLDNFIRKEIETINLKDEKNKKIKEKIYELSRNGLDANYFDIELIKLLMCNSNDIDLKEIIIKELNSLKKEIHDTVEIHNRFESRCLISSSEIGGSLKEVKRYKKRIFERISSVIVSLSIVGGIFFGTYIFMKPSSTNQGNCIETEETTIDKTKVEQYIAMEKSFELILSCLYACYIGVLAILEYIMYKECHYKIGIFNNLYQLVTYDIKDYKKTKSKYKNELKQLKMLLDGVLEEINKYEELKLRFNELYDQNKYLLDNPEKLLNKIDELSQELNKEEIKGKLKSLKRI